MANNTYGTVKQALFDPAKDCDIFYNYRPSRSSTDVAQNEFKKIENPESMLSSSKLEVGVYDDYRLPGMYDLKLPSNIFGAKGIYTIYIVPKEIQCEIKDVGALAAYPDIRGIVIDINGLDSTLSTLMGNDALTGYRVEYFDDDGNDGLVRQEYYRIVTSNSRCEPVSQNLTSGNVNSNGYRYNANGSLCFITVTPSTSPSFKSNAKPYIGTPNQKVIIRNTKFDPVCIELELTEHDIETLSIMAEGEQVRNLENGRLSFYNFDGEIYKQFEYSTVKDNYTATSIAEAKLDKTDNIDRSIDIETIRNA